MPFTDEEFEQWHREKLMREVRPVPSLQKVPIATCVHCNNPFGVNEGIVTDEVAICDICSGDD